MSDFITIFLYTSPMKLPDIIIVLSRPAESGNVGAVCRAMMNMGLSRLRVVTAPASAEAPDAALRDDVIRARAVHAAGVWDAAERFPTLEAAVADCPLVIGTTRRTGRRRKSYSLTPMETAALLRDRPGSAALVFGNERTGLEDAELNLCDMAAHIPVNPAFPSLNLSHAVQIFAYELYRALDEASETGISRWVPLAREGIAALVQSVTDSLESLGFYQQRGREDQEQFLRGIFSRAGITRREAEYMEGIFNKAARLGSRIDGKKE
jgi:tRNA/rRNA methyltransferase/tRNA (cytidine32/uridine32-2'-O)-methyltransferase